MKSNTVFPLKASKRKAVFACEVSKDYISIYSDPGTGVSEEEFPKQTSVKIFYTALQVQRL